MIPAASIDPTSALIVTASTAVIGRKGHTVLTPRQDGSGFYLSLYLDQKPIAEVIVRFDPVDIRADLVHAATTYERIYDTSYSKQDELLCADVVRMIRHYLRVHYGFGHTTALSGTDSRGLTPDTNITVSSDSGGRANGVIGYPEND